MQAAPTPTPETDPAPLDVDAELQAVTELATWFNDYCTERTEPVWDELLWLASQVTISDLSEVSA